MYLPALLAAVILAAEPSTDADGSSKVQKRRLELGLRAGGLLSAGEQTSRGFEYIHLAPGYQLSRGVVSAFYSRQLDTNACDPTTLDAASERDTTTVSGCEASNQRAGMYFRFMPFFDDAPNWVGFGAAWYQRRANGNATITTQRFADDNEEFATSRRSGFSRSEEGVSPFLLIGADFFAIGDLSVGAEAQVGADLSYSLTYNGRELIESPRLSGEVGLRVTYAIF